LISYLFFAHANELSLVFVSTTTPGSPGVSFTPIP
jgi:hypothetical protein